MAVVKKKAGTMTPKKKGSPEVSEKLELTLPTALSEPMENLGDYSILLFGAKKIGKTNLAAMFPDNFMMMTEPGGKALRLYQRPVTTWAEFQGYVKLLERDKRFKTQTVDIVDLLAKLAEKHACRRLGIDHPSEEDWGKGWAAVRDEFTTWMQRLLNNGKGTILISHATEREVKQRKGGSYHVISPTLSGQARDILEGMVDIFAYFDYEDDRRVLTIRGSENIAAGNRLRTHFRWNGIDVPQIDMGTSAEEGYKNLVDCFNNKYPYTPPVAEDAVVAAPVKKAKLKKKV